MCWRAAGTAEALWWALVRHNDMRGCAGGGGGVKIVRGSDVMKESQCACFTSNAN